MNCPRCYRSLPAGFALAGCPFCGRALQPPIIPAGSESLYPPNRAFCWTIFWIALLGGPALAYLSLVANNDITFLGNDNTFLGAVIGGAVISGFALARIFSKTVAGLILKGILLAMAAAIVYTGIFFVGCVAAFSNWAQ
jgi:hypothetical protein